MYGEKMLARLASAQVHTIFKEFHSMGRLGFLQIIFTDFRDSLIRLEVDEAIGWVVKSTGFFPVCSVPDQEAVTPILRMGKVKNILDDLELEIRYKTRN